MDLFDTLDLSNNVDNQIETVDDNYLNQNVDIKLNDDIDVIDDSPENLDELIEKIEDVSKNIENSQTNEINELPEINNVSENTIDNKFELLEHLVRILVPKNI